MDRLRRNGLAILRGRRLPTTGPHHEVVQYVEYSQAGQDVAETLARRVMPVFHRCRRHVDSTPSFGWNNENQSNKEGKKEKVYGLLNRDGTTSDPTG